mgnify:CR=1 FL=1
MSTPRLTDHELDALLETALKVVRQAADIARRSAPDLDVQTKSSRNDLVTAVDRSVEARSEEHTSELQSR